MCSNLEHSWQGPFSNKRHEELISLCCCILTRSTMVGSRLYKRGLKSEYDTNRCIFLYEPKFKNMSKTVQRHGPKPGPSKSDTWVFIWVCWVKICTVMNLHDEDIRSYDNSIAEIKGRGHCLPNRHG